MSDNDRPAWSAAWGVVAAVFGAAAVAVWIAVLQPASVIPRWVAYGTTGLTLAALYLCFAYLAGWWPVRSASRDAPIDLSAAQAEPLAVQVIDCWDLFTSINSESLYAVKLEFRNRANRAIRITDVTCRAMPAAQPELAGGPLDGRVKRPGEYPGYLLKKRKPRLPDSFRVEPVKTVSGWLVAPGSRTGPALSASGRKLRIVVSATDEHLRSYTATREMIARTGREGQIAPWA